MKTVKTLEIILKSRKYKIFLGNNLLSQIDFILENHLTNTKPSKFANKNLLKAKSIYQYFKKIDVGQSIIIQNQLALGLEAIEGTDELIARCSNYKRKGDKFLADLLKITCSII